MKETLKNVPSALKRQIFKRLGISVFFLLLGAITWINSQEVLFALPCFIAGFFFVLSGVNVLYASLTKRYVVLLGECESIEQTRFIKRIKAVYLTTDYGRVKLPIRKKMRGLRVGLKVRCYISLKASVYEYEGVQVVGDYYVIEIL